MPRRTRNQLIGLAIAIAFFAYFASRSKPEAEAPRTSRRSREVSDAELQGREPPPTGEPAPTPPVPPEREGGVTIVGVVIDDATHRGFAGARVVAACPGREEWEVATVENGTFRLPFGPRPHREVGVSLRVLTPDGRGANALTPIAPVGSAVEDVGALLLRSTMSLVVKTVHDGKPVVGASVFVSSRPDRVRRYAGYRFGRAWPGFAYQAVSDDSGLARLEGVPTGVLRVLVLADGALRGERIVITEGADSPTEVELVPARDLRVEVVWKDTGAPIPGCVLALDTPAGLLEEPGPPATTNEEGVAILRGLPDGVGIRVSVLGNDWHTAFMKEVTKQAEPGMRELRVEIPTALTLRFPILVEDGPPLEEGLRVALDQSPRHQRLGLAHEGVVQGGELVVELYREWHERATARLPDGRVGALQIVVDWQNETRRSKVRFPLEPIVFRAPRSLRVEVVDRETGEPAAGVAVRAFLKPGERETPALLTGADGSATFEGLAASQGWVAVCANPQWVLSSRQGVFSQRQDVDLTEADAELRFDVNPVTEGVLRITTDGRPTFPPGLQVDVWCLPEGMGWNSPGDLVYDAEHAEVRFRARPPLLKPTPPARLPHEPSKFLFRIRSDTHATEIVSIPAGDPLDLAVDLLPAASLRVVVLKEEEMAVRPLLERLAAPDGWTRAWEGAVVPIAGDEDGDLYETLVPGRYRLRDEGMDWVSDEFEVLEGPRPTVFVWDLRTGVFAEGEILLPAGVDPTGLSVFVLEGDDRPRIVSGANVKDGTRFRIQIPGDRPVYLRPVHGECIPDPEQERVILTGPRTGLRLRMIKIE